MTFSYLTQRTLRQAGWPGWETAYFGQIFNITEEAQILGLLFSCVKLLIDFGNKRAWLFWGVFFTNASGHPGAKPPGTNLSRLATLD
jgi:hypothetical protein